MKWLTLVFILSLTHAFAAEEIKVKCFESRPEINDFEMTTIIKKKGKKFSYELYSQGEKVAKGKFKKKVDGEGETSSICLKKNKKLTLCLGEQIGVINTAYGQLTTLHGLKDNTTEIQVYCDSKIVEILN